MPAANILEVQHVKTESTANSASISATVSATGKNNLLAVKATQYSDSTRTVTGVSDGTNNFLQAASARAIYTGTLAVDTWYLPCSQSGKTTITATFSGAAGTFLKLIEVWEVSGFDVPTVDVVAIQSDGDSGGTTTLTGPSLSTSVRDTFIAAACLTGGVFSANPAVGNEFTAGGDLQADSSGAWCSAIATSTGAHNPAWTMTGTHVPYAASVVAFRETTGIQVRTSGAAQATSITFGIAPNSGDRLIIFGHRDGSTTPPTVPGGLTTDYNATGANTNSHCLADKICDGTETGTGAFTNATSIAYILLTRASRLGDNQSGGGSSATMSYTGLTMQDGRGQSMVVGFGAHRTATNVGTNAPSGLTLRASATDIAVFSALASAFSTQTAGVNQTSGYRTHTVEVRPLNSLVPHQTRVTRVATQRRYI